MARNFASPARTRKCATDLPRRILCTALAIVLAVGLMPLPHLQQAYAAQDDSSSASSPLAALAAGASALFTPQSEPQISKLEVCDANPEYLRVFDCPICKGTHETFRTHVGGYVENYWIENLTWEREFWLRYETLEGEALTDSYLQNNATFTSSNAEVASITDLHMGTSCQDSSVSVIKPSITINGTGTTILTFVIGNKETTATLTVSDATEMPKLVASYEEGETPTIDNGCYNDAQLYGTYSPMFELWGLDQAIYHYEYNDFMFAIGNTPIEDGFYEMSDEGRFIEGCPTVTFTPASGGAEQTCTVLSAFSSNADIVEPTRADSSLNVDDAYVLRAKQGGTVTITMTDIFDNTVSFDVQALDIADSEYLSLVPETNTVTRAYVDECPICHEKHSMDSELVKVKVRMKDASRVDSWPGSSLIWELPMQLVATVDSNPEYGRNTFGLWLEERFDLKDASVSDLMDGTLDFEQCGYSDYDVTVPLTVGSAAYTTIHVNMVDANDSKPSWTPNATATLDAEAIGTNKFYSLTDAREDYESIMGAYDTDDPLLRAIGYCASFAEGATDSSGSNLPYTVTSEDETIVRVSQDKAYPVSIGSTTLYFEDDWGNRSTCQVTVADFDQDSADAYQVTQSKVQVLVGSNFDMRSFISGSVPNKSIYCWPEDYSSDVVDIWHHKEAGVDVRVDAHAKKKGTKTIGFYVRDYNNQYIKFGSLEVEVIDPDSGQVLSSSGAEQTSMEASVWANDTTQALPDDAATLSVSKVETDDVNVKEAIAVLVEDENGEAQSNTLLDIMLQDAAGNEVEVNGTKMTVRVPLSEFSADIDPSTVKVAYVGAGEDAIEEIESWVADGYLYFVTSHFSEYLLYGDAGDGEGGGDEEPYTPPYTPPTTTPTTPTTQPMYRMYNKWSGEHLFTSDAAELKKNVKLGWTNEGVAWNAPTSGTKVYRLYNKYSGDHHFTTDVNEYNKCKKAGWTGEGVAFYSGGDQPVYRLYNKYVTSFYHHYTMDVKEQKKCIKDGWKDEKIGWYGYSA